jgi:uncharacterized protein (TIGR03067 family)
MSLNKLKTFSAVLLVVICLAGGTGTLISLAVLADASSPGPRQVSNEDRVQEEIFSYQLGDIVGARFFLKNAGNDPVQISYPRMITPSYYKALRFAESKGREIPIYQAHLRPEPVGWLSARLDRGEDAEIDGHPLSIDNVAAKQTTETVLKVEPGHTYCLRYTLPNYGASQAGELQTGKFTFTVIEKDAPRPKRLTAAELKKRIAWGSPGKNGLQVGVLLLPVPDGNPTSRPAPGEDAAEADRVALQGGWEGQSGERDGMALRDEEIKKLRISIKMDRMLMIPGGEWTPLRIKLDPAQNPKVLHATAVEGPDKDKTVPVIYRLDKEADTLTLCFDEKNGKAVPKDFAARKDSGLILLVLKHERRSPIAPAARK